jgi:hypothetical protein
MSGEKKPKKPRQSKGDGDLYFKMQINIPPSGLNPGSVCKITAPNGDIHFVTIPMDVEVGTSFIRALPKVFNEVTLGSLDTQELRQWHFHRKIELPSVTEDATDAEEKQVLLETAIKWLAENAETNGVMPDNIRDIINVKTEGGKTLYKVKERSSTESRWIESTSSELSSKHILAFEQKQKERKEAKKGKRSRDDEPGGPNVPTLSLLLNELPADAHACVVLSLFGDFQASLAAAKETAAEKSTTEEDWLETPEGLEKELELRAREYEVDMASVFGALKALCALAAVDTVWRQTARHYFVTAMFQLIVGDSVLKFSDAVGEDHERILQGVSFNGIDMGIETCATEIEHIVSVVMQPSKRRFTGAPKHLVEKLH